MLRPCVKHYITLEISYTIYLLVEQPLKKINPAPYPVMLRVFIIFTTHPTQFIYSKSF